jgi:hypothetical protein
MSQPALLYRPISALRLALLCLGLAALCVPVSATVMRYLEIEELARLSTDVLHGQVVSTKTYWDESHTRILTAVRVQITEAFKGSAKPNEIVTITQAGGELDGLRQDYSGRPIFTVGEAVVIFTKPGRRGDHIVIGLKQGKLRVAGTEALRDFSGITLLEQRASAPGTARAATGQPTRVQTRLTLNELRQRVANAR